MSTSASLPYLRIKYDGRRRVLQGCWLRSVMPFELQNGYFMLLQAAKEHQCRFWLIDTTRRHSGIGATDVYWMLDVFFPQLTAQLSGTAYLAYLMAPNQLAGVLATHDIPALPSGDNLPYYLQRFTDEKTAYAWLRACARQEQPK